MRLHGRPKHISAALLALVLLLFGVLLTACRGTSCPKGKPCDCSCAEDCSVFGCLGYSILNPITLTEQTDVSAEGKTVKGLTIFGLEDSALQDNINANLGIFVSEIADSEPEDFGQPSRLSKDGFDPLQRTIELNATWNCNDLLSLVIVDEVSNMSLRYMSLYPKSINLKTGAELKLGDLFKDDSYKEIINSAVSSAIENSSTFFDPALGAASPISVSTDENYEGAGNETPFFLSDSGLCIVLKYGTPGLGFSGTEDEVVTIGYERFKGLWTIAAEIDSSIYIDPSACGYLLNYADSANIVVDEEERDLGSDSVYLYDSLVYPKEFPDKLVKAGKKMLDEARIEDADARAALSRQNSSWVSSNNIVTCYSIAGLNVIKHEVAENVSGDGMWTTVTKCRIFDRGGRELNAKDIFGEWNYKPFFKERLAEFWSLSYGADGSSLESGDSEELSPKTLERLMDGSSLCLASEGISFYTDCVKINRIGEAGEYSYCTSLSVFADYAEIGITHLAALFDIE